MGKGEIARYEQFLLFPLCFQKASFPEASKGFIVWEWVKYKGDVLEALILERGLSCSIAEIREKSMCEMKLDHAKERLYSHGACGGGTGIVEIPHCQNTKYV